MLENGAVLGTDAAYVYYSGHDPSFTKYRQLLSQIGEPRYLGGDPGRAQLMYRRGL